MLTATNMKPRPVVQDKKKTGQSSKKSINSGSQPAAASVSGKKATAGSHATSGKRKFKVNNTLDDDDDSVVSIPMAKRRKGAITPAAGGSGSDGSADRLSDAAHFIGKMAFELLVLESSTQKLQANLTDFAASMRDDASAHIIQAGQK